jgi:hypothetical protein
MTFFGQIFEFLILLYLCEENEDKTKYNSFKCPSEAVFYSFSVLCVIAVIFLLIISFITISVYFKPLFMKDKNDSLKKITSFSNLVFFVNKILFVVLTSIKTDNIIYMWFMLIVLFISTFANMIYFTKYNNYANNLLKELNKFFSVILFSLMSCLILGKIFSGWGFNGVLYLFLITILSAIISAILYKSQMYSFSHLNFRTINSGCERLMYINTFLNLVKTKHLSRDKTLLYREVIIDLKLLTLLFHLFMLFIAGYSLPHLSM